MGLDWMRQLGKHLNTKDIEIQIHNKNLDIIKLEKSENKTTQLKEDFKDLFDNNKEIKDLWVKTNWHRCTNHTTKSKGAIPIHTQEQVAKKVKQLIDKGFPEREDKITEGCFVSPAVITVKIDESIKIALASWNLNDITEKNENAKYGRISRKITQGKECEVLATDFDYANGLTKL